MRINAEGGAVTAPRALLLNEFDLDEPDICAVLVLSAPAYVEQGARLLEDGVGQLAGVSRSRRIMTCEVLMDHTLATGKLLTTRQPSAA